MMAVFEPHKFSILDIENLRLHYARTCAAWLQNFEAVADEVEEMYGEEFVRMWRLYLAGSSAGFQSGTLQLYQVLFAPHGNNRRAVDSRIPVFGSDRGSTDVQRSRRHRCRRRARGIDLRLETSRCGPRRPGAGSRGISAQQAVCGLGDAGGIDGSRA